MLRNPLTAAKRFHDKNSLQFKKATNTLHYLIPIWKSFFNNNNKKPLQIFYDWFDSKNFTIGSSHVAGNMFKSQIDQSFRIKCLRYQL